MVKLRRVKDDHLEAWGENFTPFRGPTATLPNWPLVDEAQTEVVLDANENEIEVQDVVDGGATRRSFCEMMVKAVGKDRLLHLLNDRGMMLWLAAQYQTALRRYDSKKMVWTTKEIDRFLPAAGGLHKYRHDVEGMLRIHLLFPDDANVFLAGPMCMRPDSMEQFFSTSANLASPGIVGAYNRIFHDETNLYSSAFGEAASKPTGFVKGASTTKKVTSKPGFRRFKLLIERRAHLVDVHALSADDIITMFGSTFDWTGFKERET